MHYKNNKLLLLQACIRKLGMDNNKNFMSQYIMRVIIAINDIITMSLKVQQPLNCEDNMDAFYDVHIFEQWIL